jgi:hypothetical protein
VSTIIQGYQLRTLLLGDLVTKPAAALPQTQTLDLFTVSGGAVLVTSLLGLVTTAIASSDPELTLGTAPVTGTAEVAGIASSTVLTSAEAGTWVTVVSDAGLPSALVVMATAAKAGSTVFLTAPFVVAPGYVTWTTGANKTGDMAWYLTYVPLDTGASVS